MNIFANLPFEFLKKIMLFWFGTTKIIYIYIYYICDCPFNGLKDDYKLHHYLLI